MEKLRKPPTLPKQFIRPSSAARPFSKYSASKMNSSGPYVYDLVKGESTCRLQNGQGQAGILYRLARDTKVARGTKALLWRAMGIPLST
jgi:hypothetical protein